MAAAPPPLPKHSQRKQLEHSRSRKFLGFHVGSPGALAATCFVILMLCSLLFFDLEILYGKPSMVAPQPAEDQLRSQELATKSQIQTTTTTESVTTTNIDPTASDDTFTDRVIAGGVHRDASTGFDGLSTSTIDRRASTDRSTDSDGDTGASTGGDVDGDMDGGLAPRGDNVAATPSLDLAENPDDDGEEDLVHENATLVLSRKLKGCDITQGRWVYDNESHPLYRTRNCPFADSGFSCEDNGRPDKEFMSYRWQPHACDLPRFNATDVLERLRGQRMVFVGDSLGRNNWESMLCMLAEGVANKSRIFEVNGEPITKHTGKLIYRFADYNCTVEYYRDPFLVPQTRPPKGAPANVTYVLQVDRVSWTTEKWINADIIIFNAGHWWTEHKIFRQGCRFEEGGKVQDYDLFTGLGKALQTWATYLEKHVDLKKTEVFWLSFPSVHFRGGTWNRGGHCHKEKRPLTEEEARNEWQTPWINQIVKEKLLPNLRRKQDSVTFLDITTATNYRAGWTWGLVHVGHQEVWLEATQSARLQPFLLAWSAGYME